MSILKDYGGPDLPHVRYRPGAKTVTFYGHDTDPIAKVYRFHRGVDRCRGDGLIYVPFKAHKAIIERNHPTYGTLTRLVYDGWELRIAHIEKHNQSFLALADGGAEIPADMVIGHEGMAGKATGPHTHTEVVSIGGVAPDIAEMLKARGYAQGVYWSDEMLKDRGDYEAIKRYMNNEAPNSIGKIYELGPIESKGDDWRTGGIGYWFDSLAVFGF